MLEFQYLKEDCKTYTKKKTSNEKLTEDWKLTRRTLENKQVKSAKLRANNKWELDGKKSPKTFFKVLDGKNMQNQTKFELYKLMV